MKKKISKLSINKVSVSKLSDAKGGHRCPLCAFTEGPSCEGNCNPTMDFACTYTVQTNWC